jgi:transcriptional regulator with XRE-family HTH domain
MDGPPSGGPWLDAAPFRAYACHLLGASGLTARELAVLLDVSFPLLRRLLGGAGRPLRRIDPISAGRLLAVTPRDARCARTRTVPAERAVEAVWSWLQRGRELAELAGLTGADVTQLDQLARGGRAVVPQRLDLRLRAAERALDGLPLSRSRITTTTRVVAPVGTEPSAFSQTAVRPPVRPLATAA